MEFVVGRPYETGMALGNGETGGSGGVHTAETLDRLRGQGFWGRGQPDSVGDLVEHSAKPVEGALNHFGGAAAVLHALTHRFE